ncbi:MAG: Nif3-like dinuclear metal center hexameric protein [Defluviitaleaceae bacterium]|nr:Nif3-like dinuclear metal center hexameric protein [Defluviitaleaceae bacterium]MCL2835983.1 Nif3-like dinuclear metal center hexameric protein [Defluviitaleaceae bacterium]
MEVNTTDLMNAALRLAGLTAIPVDSDIMVPGKDIKKVLVGVDMDTAEILLAKELGCDCVVSHHPKNTNAAYADIMDHHIDKLVECGVPINKAQRVLKTQKEAVALNRHVGNTDRFASAAKLLGMPYMCIHTPADLISEAAVQKVMDEKLGQNPKAALKDVLDALNEIGEYKKSEVKSEIRCGAEKNFAGKIYVSMSGGTNGGPEVLKAYFEAGIGTIIQMHATKDDAKAATDQNIGNLIVTPHMASDSIGMNVILDEWEKMGVEVVVMSGIVR